jgi:hypothetical protein
VCDISRIQSRQTHDVDQSNFVSTYAGILHPAGVPASGRSRFYKYCTPLGCQKLDLTPDPHGKSRKVPS